jgi:hypothetical protein
MSFPKNEWFSLLTSGQTRVYLLCAPGNVLADVSSVVPSGLRLLESTTRRGHRPLRAGGQGLPQPQPGK